MDIKVKRRGKMIALIVSENDAHSLRVSLRPCQCREIKSNSTEAIRQNLDKELARALYQKDNEL